MLRFNCYNLLYKKSQENFNTSYVAVQPRVQTDLCLPFADFNTSYVAVQRLIWNVEKKVLLDFNTSYVAVQRELAMEWGVN